MVCVLAGASSFSPLLSPVSLLPHSLGRIQTQRHLCWLASLPMTQTTAALLLLFLHLLLLTVAELL